MLRITNRHLINLRMLLRIMGWLLLIEAFFMLLPMTASIICHESDWLCFLATALFTAAAGILLTIKSKPTSTVTGKRDGFLLTASVWVVFSLFGMIPFLTCSSPVSLSDAFFEAMSGFTTTGASVITSVASMSHGIHLWRAMMQWIGGMGIILFTLAVIPMLNHAGGIQMFNAEVTGITHDKISPRISQTAKTLWLIYLSLTAAAILLLWAGPMTLFEAVCHGFGTVSTGGYTIYDEGLSFWHNSVYTKVVITVFMFIGGTSFALLFRVIKGNFRALRTNDVFKTYLGVISGMLLLFIISIIHSGAVENWQSVTIDPLFQIISTLTSTGYTVSNFESWGPFVLALTFLMMFFGACAGSTSGGAKIDRILYLFKNVRNELYRTIYPNSILSVKVNDKVINPDIVSKVIAFLCLYALLIVLGGIALTCTGVPLVDSFFSSFSCLSNTGLGAGVTGYGSSYDILPDSAKWILSFLMLTGRLEIFTVLILFTRPFWSR